MRSLICLLVLFFPLLGFAAEKPVFQAGTASQVITPTEPLWMAGYAARTKPGEKKLHDLWVKALALEDATGTGCLFLASDLCGIPRELSVAVCEEVSKQTGLKREQIALTCSHTHSGPVLTGNLRDMYPLTPEQPERIRKYTEQLQKWMVQTLVAAWKDRKPAHLKIGKSIARFAMNRRQETGKGVVIGRNPTGPVDHEVPVLQVTDADGKIKAIVFGYACHNTTLDINEWNGDYAGFAQIEVEKKYPGALALFWIGFGADANPEPRRTVEMCEKYGKELAQSVTDALSGSLTPITTKITPKYVEIALKFDTIPDKTFWAGETMSKNLAAKKRAERMLELLEKKGSIPDQYSYYPIQVWRFGDQWNWIHLGGEVVIDYNLRIKKEYTGKATLWMTGYANDVMSYIPSVRVLKEGGYEADFSQIYYGMPTKWSSTIEDAIISKVQELLK